jgi:D-alanyl-D-alanine carboxypeptidase
MSSKGSLRSLSLTFAFLCLLGANAQSQEQMVDARTKDQLKTIMSHLLETIYVSPDIGKRLGAQLRARFESGAYKDIATPAQLAEALTRDLRDLSKDKHLHVRYDPAASGSDILTLQEWETRRSSMFQPQSPIPQPASPPGGPQSNPRMMEQLQRTNYHFREVKYLSGNIGYIDLGGFAPGQAARDTAAKTMADLVGSYAMVIDLRRCPGGSAEMVNFLASYFFDKEPRVLMNRYIRPTGETIQSKTLPDIPGRRLLDTDLYLLVSGKTGSACESFTYTLQQYGRAKVVGERTAGAGYNNVFIPIGKGYIFSVSYGRPIHPRSGKGWEGEGVQPDIAAPSDDALTTAHREALQKLIGKTTDENRKNELMLALQNLTVQSKLPAETISRNTGDYSAIAKELDTVLEQSAAKDAFSGAVLIAKDGEPLFKKAYGLANRATNTPNKTKTKFNIGSMNKMFTAVAIAQLAERGKLSFNDTIGKLLPDYPNKAVAEKVTVHQLLTHTSGLGNYQNETYMAKLGEMKTIADLLPLFAGEPLAFEPGSKMVYSNSGFVVLGAIIEKVSGQDYFDYVREQIFKPAGMASTDSYEKGKDIPNLALGYMRMNDRGMPDPSVPLRENTSILAAKASPAGGGYSTVNDMLKFSLALRANKLLSRKYTEIVTTGKVEVGGQGRKYAYGFGDNVIDGKRIVGHNGGGPGIGANFDMFPELGFTTVILTNFSPPAMMPVVKKLRDLITATTSSATASTTAPISTQQDQTLSHAEQEVRKLEREWLDAYEKRDVETMNRILADDFRLTRSDGSVQTKADILAELKAGRESSRPAMKFSTEDVQSRVEKEAVVLSGRVILRSETRSMQARYTDTYVKRNGRWQVVSSQMQRVGH